MSVLSPEGRGGGEEGRGRFVVSWGGVNMRREYLRSRGLRLDPVFQSNGGQQLRGEPGVDSGIGDRVDGWVTTGALGCSGGRGR